MKSEQEALDDILAALPDPVPEPVALDDAAGRYLLEDVRSTFAMPGFDNSAMDGYALHAADCGRRDHRVEVVGEQPAGRDRGLAVSPGKCVRIFTGAPLPAQTSAVVMQEDTVADGGGIRIVEPAAESEFVRPAGSDVGVGVPLAARGDRLTPGRIAVLAAQGIDSLRCGRRPAVRILCTGDELIAPGNPLPAAGCLYNSNGPMLAAAVAAEGCPVRCLTLPDDRAQLTDAIAAALAEAQVLLLAAGVSVGDHDCVTGALRDAGIEPAFHRVRLKPGKPFLFARSGDRLVFGLPGNPVSAMVTAVLFALPAVRSIAGASREQALPARTRATLAAPAANPGDRPHYLRGRLDPRSGTFAPLGLQASHALFGLSQSNALVRLDPDQRANPGDPVECVLL